MIVLFASLLLAGSPVLTPPPSGKDDADQAAPAKVKAKKAPKICRQDEDFNSRIHSVTCKTADEWQVEDARRQNAGIAGNVAH